MTKYKFRLPYDYVKSGEVVGYVYAEDSEQALDRLHDADYWIDEEHIDRYDGDTNYDHSDVEIEEEEENVEYDYGFSHDNNSQTFTHNGALENDILPSYFLAELPLL